MYVGHHTNIVMHHTTGENPVWDFAANRAGRRKFEKMFDEEVLYMLAPAVPGGDAVLLRARDGKEVVREDRIMKLLHGLHVLSGKHCTRENLRKRFSASYYAPDYIWWCDKSFETCEDCVELEDLNKKKEITRMSVSRNEIEKGMRRDEAVLQRPTAQQEDANVDTGDSMEVQGEVDDEMVEEMEADKENVLPMEVKKSPVAESSGVQTRSSKRAHSISKDVPATRGRPQKRQQGNAGRSKDRQGNNTRDVPRRANDVPLIHETPTTSLINGAPTTTTAVQKRSHAKISKTSEENGGNNEAAQKITEVPQQESANYHELLDVEKISTGKFERWWFHPIGKLPGTIDGSSFVMAFFCEKTRCARLQSVGELTYENLRNFISKRICNHYKRLVVEIMLPSSLPVCMVLELRKFFANVMFMHGIGPNVVLMDDADPRWTIGRNLEKAIVRMMMNEGLLAAIPCIWHEYICRIEKTLNCGKYRPALRGQVPYQADYVLQEMTNVVSPPLAQVKQENAVDEEGDDDGGYITIERSDGPEEIVLDAPANAAGARAVTDANDHFVMYQYIDKDGNALN